VFDDAVNALSEQGANVVELDDPVDFEAVLKDHRCVMAAEAAGVHSDWLNEFPDDYPPRIRELILEGRSLTALDYIQAKDRMNSTAWAILGAMMQKVHALMTPATISTAPDSSTTGDPAFNSPWSFTWLPTVSFPIGLAIDGLPVAIQVIGRFLEHHELLRDADWCEQAIRTWRQSGN
jgi:aspartyl-tRNA(Asn)/glutamyl-tRNA(Gln) amidotransferase subunit A